MRPVIPAILTNDPREASEKLALLCARRLPLHLDIIEPSWGAPTLGIADWATIQQQTGVWPEYVEWHLMVDDPLPYIPQLHELGTVVIIHQEVTTDQVAVTEAAQAAGLTLYYTLNPETTLAHELQPVGLQIMGVNPGASGQAQLEDTPQRVALARKVFRDTILSVDGGVTVENALALVAAGAHSLVVNSSYWKADDQQQIVTLLTTIVAGGEHGVPGSD